MDTIANGGITMLLTLSVLVLVSIGLALVFGMMRVINLAHGQFIMLGAYATLVATRAGLPLWLAVAAAATVVGAIGLVVERLLIRRLYGRLEETMLATWGLSLILTQVVVLIFGPATTGISAPLSSIAIGRYRISEYQLVVIAVAVCVLIGTWLIFTRTNFGLMARAVMQDQEMASAVGIDSRRINMAVFAGGAFLAGLAGGVLAPLVGVVPNLGEAYIAKAFMVVIVGGPGPLTGTALAAGLLGTIESAVGTLTSQFIGQAALLMAAIVTLRVLPEGLSGRLGRSL